MDLSGLRERIKYYQRVILDLGTGDGRYVRFLADQHPDWFIIGVDSCRENLRTSSRLDLKNALFVIASAQDLRPELRGLATQVTINFPWGSLLKSLLAGDTDLMNGLSSIVKQYAHIDIHLNGGALAESGVSLERGTHTIYDNMNCHGWILKHPSLMNCHTLRNFPTTWAKRLAHGRDPRAMALSGKYTI